MQRTHRLGSRDARAPDDAEHNGAMPAHTTTEHEPDDPYAAPEPGRELTPARARDVQHQPKPRDPHRSADSPEKRTRPAGLSAAMVALLGWLLSTMLLPWSILGAALGAVAVVLGWRARRNSPRRALATTAIALGVLGAVLGTTVSVFATVYRSELASYQECIRGANTEAARQECQQQLEDLRDQILRTR